jgi:hypothetical protein
VKIRFSRRLVFIVAGILLILQFLLLLAYAYLREINQAPFRIPVDPVLAFFISWILLCIGVMLIIMGGRD